MKERSSAERQAVNSIIQGTASDIIKYAMIKMNELILSVSNYLYHRKQPPSSSSVVPSLPPLVSSLSEQQLILLSQSKLLMQIHDELIFEIPNQKETIDLFQGLIREIMEKEVMKEFQFQIPLQTNISLGPTWGDLEPMVKNPEKNIHLTTSDNSVEKTGLPKNESAVRVRFPLEELIELSDDDDDYDEEIPEFNED
jgi:hypothetical protein